MENATKIILPQQFFDTHLFFMQTYESVGSGDNRAFPGRSNSSASFEMQIILLQSSRHSATEQEPCAPARVEEGEVLSSPERRVVTWPKAQ
jgi:hypothetical protein